MDGPYLANRAYRAGTGGYRFDKKFPNYAKLTEGSESGALALSSQRPGPQGIWARAGHRGRITQF